MIVVLPADLEQPAENDGVVGFCDEDHLNSADDVIELFLFFLDDLGRVSETIMHLFYLLAGVLQT